jgi:membrane protein YqaA with SNARE-associated domain
VISVILLVGLQKALADLGELLVTYGAVGLFGIAVLDSALVPLPSGPDLVMIALTTARPNMMAWYALAATGGSTLGCTVLYYISRRTGTSLAGRFTGEKWARMERLLGRYDLLAIMVPAVLPPPFPFKAFVLAAGFFKFRVWRFVVAISLGRAARFLIWGWLSQRFGQDALRVVRGHGVEVLIGVGLIVAAGLLGRLWVGRIRRARRLQSRIDTTL